MTQNTKRTYTVGENGAIVLLRGGSPQTFNFKTKRNICKVQQKWRQCNKVCLCIFLCALKRCKISIIFPHKYLVNLVGKVIQAYTGFIWNDNTSSRFLWCYSYFSHVSRGEVHFSRELSILFSLPVWRESELFTTF